MKKSITFTRPRSGGYYKSTRKFSINSYGYREAISLCPSGVLKLFDLDNSTAIELMFTDKQPKGDDYYEATWSQNSWLSYYQLDTDMMHDSKGYSEWPAELDRVVGNWFSRKTVYFYLVQ